MPVHCRVTGPDERTDMVRDTIAPVEPSPLHFLFISSPCVLPLPPPPSPLLLIFSYPSSSLYSAPLIVFLSFSPLLLTLPLLLIFSFPSFYSPPPSFSISSAPLSFSPSSHLPPPQIVALLCAGLYPNICFHKEKRRVLTAEGKSALIHKSSVNLINKDPKFPSPYFIFGEKVVIFHFLPLHKGHLDVSF